MTTRIAWIQSRYQGTVESTHRHYLAEAQKLADQGIDLLVLPELFTTRYFCISQDSDNFDLAISIDHPHLADWREMARTLNCVIVYSFFEKRADGLYHNTACVIERDGSTAGIYRKGHIPDDPGFNEKYYFSPGDTGFHPIATSAGVLGVLICWDQWFPEAARAMCLRGAQILIYPTAIAWDAQEPDDIKPTQCDAWITVMRGHAIANNVYAMAVNRIGDEGHLTFWGNSFLCRPDGSLQAHQDHTDDGPEWSVADFAQTEALRRAWPFFRDRRTDDYGVLLKKWGTP